MKNLSPKSDDGRYFLTPAAIKRLQEKLEELKSQLPTIKEEKMRAAELGDFSENAEYQDAKARLRRANSQIASIQDRLLHAVEIQSGSKGGLIGIGSTAVLELNGKLISYQLVGPFEAAPARGRISHLSPLGKSLIGHRLGDSVVISTPRGDSTYTIRKVN